MGNVQYSIWLYNRRETYGTAYNPKTDNRRATYKVCCVCVHVYNKYTCKNRTDAVWAMRQGGTKAIWVVCFESLNKTFLVVCKCGSMLQTCSVAVYHVQYRAHSPWPQPMKYLAFEACILFDLWHRYWNTWPLKLACLVWPVAQTIKYLATEVSMSCLTCGTDPEIPGHWSMSSLTCGIEPGLQHVASYATVFAVVTFGMEYQIYFAAWSSGCGLKWGKYSWCGD